MIMPIIISHNYCCKCRKFRKLFTSFEFENICATCLGYEPKIINTPTNSKKEATLSDNLPKTKKTKKTQYSKCSIVKRLRLYEEKLLYEHLKGIHIRKKQYWKSAIANKLGWTVAKVSATARRIERKGKLDKKDSNELVIDLLKSHPEGMTPREMQRVLKFSSIPSLYNTLQNLLKEGKITRKKDKNSRHSVYTLL